MTASLCAKLAASKLKMKETTLAAISKNQYLTRQGGAAPVARYRPTPVVPGGDECDRQFAASGVWALAQ